MNIHLQFELKSMVAAFGLMSRLPIVFLLKDNSLDASHHHRAQIWYALVGLALGLILSLVVISTASLLPASLSDNLSAILVLIIWVSFTGGLHLDGLADSADAWIGGMGDSEKTLRIMKDPSAGPAAVSILILVLLFKFVLIAETFLSADSLWHVATVLILVPVLARSWLLPLLASMPYARSGQGGMASAIAPDFPLNAAILSFAIVHIIAAIWLSAMFSIWAVIFVLLTSALICFVLRKSSMSRLGGYTGDVLGAAIELYELALLFVMTVVLVASTSAIY